MIKYKRLISITIITFISLISFTGINVVMADSGELGKGCKDDDECNSGLVCMRKFGYDRDICVRLGANSDGGSCGMVGLPCCKVIAPSNISVPAFCFNEGETCTSSGMCVKQTTGGDDSQDEQEIDYKNGAENCNKDDPGCISCIGQGGIWTAIGCIDPSPTGILTGLIRIGYGVMGGVALLQLIFVGLMYQSGDEAKIADARSKLFATLGGVALLTFSVLILRIIGINILDVIPVGGI